MMEVKNIKQKNEEISDFIHLVASNTDAAKVKENSIKSNPFWIARNINLWQRRPVQWSIKRIFDLIVASSLVILLSPLLIIIAILVKLSSPGPIFFKSRAIGKNGKPFMFYKFRSMFVTQGEDEERKKMMIINRRSQN